MNDWRFSELIKHGEVLTNHTRQSSLLPTNQTEQFGTHANECAIAESNYGRILHGITRLTRPVLGWLAPAESDRTRPPALLCM